MGQETTREPQYQESIEARDRHGLTTLGLLTNRAWREDPRRLSFVLARYKFVSKMLSGFHRVLEVGCGDAFGTRIVQQEVHQILAIDFDPIFVRDALTRMDARWPFECRVHDMLSGPVDGEFQGAYALDVIEHIPAEHERRFVTNIAQSIAAHGVLIIGTPSLQSQAYASGGSRAGHINCKDAPSLRGLLAEFFHQVFIFSMNDEVVHTGFSPMAHYLFALCCSPKGDVRT